MLTLIAIATFAVAHPPQEVVAVAPPEVERRAAALYGELKCPVCKNQSLASSTSFLAEEMKQQIRELVMAGRSDDEILEHFVSRYGDWIRMRPPVRGFGVWAWAVPAAALLGGAALLLITWARAGKQSGEADDVEELDDDTRARIAALIQERESP